MTVVTLHTVVGIITQKDHVLLFQRPPQSHAYGLWCFPGGKVEDAESIEQALLREMHEEVGIIVTEKRQIMHLSGWQNNKTIQLYVYHIQSYDDSFTNPESHIWTWGHYDVLEHYPTFKINLRVVEYLKKTKLKDTETLDVIKI